MYFSTLDKTNITLTSNYQHVFFYSSTYVCTGQPAGVTHTLVQLDRIIYLQKWQSASVASFRITLQMPLSVNSTCCVIIRRPMAKSGNMS